MIVARFMTGHCHLGDFCLPEEDELVACPLCAEDYTREHFLRECVAVSDLRQRWLQLGNDRELQDLIQFHCYPLGNFLLDISERILGLDAA